MPMGMAAPGNVVVKQRQGAVKCAEQRAVPDSAAQGCDAWRERIRTSRRAEVRPCTAAALEVSVR